MDGTIDDNNTADYISGWDLAKWLERLAAKAKVATVLGLIPASSKTMESGGAADEAVLNNVNEKKKIPP